MNRRQKTNEDRAKGETINEYREMIGGKRSRDEQDERKSNVGK